MNRENPPEAPRGATRRRILNMLKKSDGLTADQLAALLGVTSMAVRKHIAALERDGLIESTTVRGAIGRPANLYKLSSLADSFFPKHYDQVITELLADLVEIDGQQKVDLLLERRTARTRQFLEERIRPASSFAERVRLLAEGMDELGYLACYEQIDETTYCIKHYNCAINRVASCFPAACHYEVQMYQEILGAEVERSSHLLAGDHLCCFIIRPFDPQGTAKTKSPTFTLRTV